MNIQKLVLANLIKSETYTRRVINFIKPEYFPSGEPERIAFEITLGYFEKYDGLPPPEALAIELQARRDLNEGLFDKTISLFGEIVDDSDPFPDQDWLVDQTETMCKDRALHNALMKAIEIADKAKGGLSAGEIPKLMQDALAVSFDAHVGHDYIEDAANRWDYQHKPTRRIPFALEAFNKVTKGGVHGKTLNVVMAVSNAGKSLLLVDFAANYLMMGKSVLYISGEMSEEVVANRIDANLMDISLGDMEELPRDTFLKKIKRIREKTTGRLKIKEYSPQTAGASHFRALIHDLKIKQGFVPDVIMVDYLNLFVPTTLGKGDHNSNTRITRVCEEIRGLAREMDIPIWSATQTNRAGYGASSAGAENVADAIGIIMTADFLFTIGDDENLRNLGQFKVKQIKSRYNNKDWMNEFYIGVNKIKQKLFDVDTVYHEEVKDSPKTSPGISSAMKSGIGNKIGGMSFSGVR